jgi:large subunit ribosomal protein L15
MPLYRRVPKLHHFPLVRRTSYTLINVGDLQDLEPGSEVSLESLLAAGIATTNDGPLKILGDGDLEIQLTVKASAFSQSARAKIEAAGGEARLLGAKTAAEADQASEA